jgi:FkbM family methyltransferase
MAIGVRHRWVDSRLGLPSRRSARRAAARSFYLGDGVVMARVLNRYTLYLPARDTSLVPDLLFNGWWEVTVTQTLASLLRPGMVVGDVGANVGYFTALMADRVGPAGHVHAFEPNSEMCGLLQRSLFVNHLSDRATIHEVALGDRDGGEMMLHIPGDAMGGAAVFPLPASDAAGSADIRRVPIQRLDSLPEAHAIELLKIDAEGSEPAIWAGMHGLLQGATLRTVLMEFAWGIYPYPEVLLQEISRAGFEIRLVDRYRGPVKTTTAQLLAPEHRNRALMLLLTR